MHFCSIDTENLEDKVNTKNEEKIKDYLHCYDNFQNQKILIVNIMTIESMIVLMKSFPIKNFWKYELIVNTRSDIASPILNIEMEKTSIFY